MSKKLVSLMLVTILIIGGVLVKPDSASAASTTTAYTQYHKAVGKSIKHTLFTSDSGSNVKISVVQGTVVGGTYECNGCQYDVKVELQRRVSGTFKTIATKSGTVRAGRPLHHTFTNVKSGTMRAIITSKLPGDTRVAVSTYWTR
ncbi:hypothetical protein [Terribacillus saccharophilus]|uniref:Uncharacterized protein n=1 Tax=Terribacillus saccharophilus TaxID=361277 RepID=A0ABX4GWB2_9BACI|nr:hypothetical protein [Terribacillus saccharophilus]PAD34808.1 hypothetical protein CHH56_13585 [Terribacillus saccharophilus]PAD95554.1 hypothetical protein CHH50_13820 [Terribacillus saccharophilus]PAD99133.1 hypothetical protein CHH48_14715 [Terribacillus saccharophilus]